jgi:bacillolysin
LKEDFESRQDDVVEPKQDTFYDKAGGAHQRFIQTFNGYPVEGASMVLHTDADGEVIGVNGEYVDGTGISTIATLSSSQAVEMAIAAYFSSDDNFEIIGAALLTVVRTFDGDASFAYKVRVKYLAPDTKGVLKFQEDCIYADAHTGELVQALPQAFASSDPSITIDHEHPEAADTEIDKTRRLERGTPSIKTYNCHQGNYCNWVTSSSTEINTGDLAIDSAHNYALATYKY